MVNVAAALTPEEPMRKNIVDLAGQVFGRMPLLNAAVLERFPSSQMALYIRKIEYYSF